MIGQYYVCPYKSRVRVSIVMCSEAVVCRTDYIVTWMTGSRSGSQDLRVWISGSGVSISGSEVWGQDVSGCWLTRSVCNAVRAFTLPS